MRTVILLASLFAGVFSVAWAEEEKSQQQIEIEKLSFLVGHWAGRGQTFAKDGTKSTYHDDEQVWFDVQNSLLIIQANGSKNGNHYYGIHTVIYYDVEAEHYWYNPFTARGSRPYRCNLEQQLFRCYSLDQKNRLSFLRLPGGEWNEYGETLEDGIWRKTFETILTATES